MTLRFDHDVPPEPPSPPPAPPTPAPDVVPVRDPEVPGEADPMIEPPSPHPPILVRR